MKKNSSSANFWLIIIILLFEYSIFFYGDLRRPAWVLLIIYLAVALLYKKKRIIDQNIVIVLIAVYSLILLQYSIYGGISLAAIYKPVWLFLTPFLLITIQKNEFLNNLSRGIYALSLISTIFYLVHTLYSPAGNIIDQLFSTIAPYSGNKEPTSLIIYSIPAQYFDFPWPRNSGFAHEPGAFAMIVLLGIMTNTMVTKNPFNKRNIIMGFILLTTFSTMAYLNLFLYFGFYLLRSNFHPLMKVILVPTFVAIFLFVYNNTDFMSSKMKSSYTADAIAIDSGEEMQRGRFFAFVKAAEVFAQNPFTGQGIISASETDIVSERASFGYGFMGLLARYGVFFGVFYLYFFYRGFEIVFRNHGFMKKDALIAFIVINLSLLTQPFFFSLPIVAFFIIGYNYKSTIQIHHFPRLSYRKQR